MNNGTVTTSAAHLTRAERIAAKVQRQTDRKNEKRATKEAAKRAKGETGAARVLGLVLGLVLVLVLLPACSSDGGLFGGGAADATAQRAASVTVNVSPVSTTSRGDAVADTSAWGDSREGQTPSGGTSTGTPTTTVQTPGAP